jgi:hypothetical protein
MPVNLGGGTNEARIVLANSNDLQLYMSDVRFSVADQISITTLQTHIVAYVYVAAFAGSRYPTGVGILSGSGMAAPSGY